MIDDAIFFKPIRELARMIKQREVSPVELATTSLDRLETTGAKLNAVATLMRDQAMAEARAAEQEITRGRYRGPLHGVPYGVKDLLATKGVPTTWGAEPYRSQVFDYDATVVTRLRQAGAVLVAKLAMVELAGGMGYNAADASWTGPALTPWNTGFWAGGSSSGVGAAVGAGLVPFGIGSETSGSILTPSAFSGVTGLRPTYGLVSRHGAMALSWSLDKLGPMCRTADDAGIILAAISGRDELDPTSLADAFTYADKISISTKKLRVGVCKEGTDGMQEAVIANFEASLKVLGDSVEIVRDVEWPDMPWGPAVGTIVAAEGAAAFVDLIESGKVGELRNERDRRGGYGAMVIPAVDYIQAMRVRKPMKRAVNALYEKVDVIASPTRSSVAYPTDKSFNDAYPGLKHGPSVIAGGNLVGIPAICLPNGFGENDLPTSIAFLGPARSERHLVMLGNALQERTDWHTRQPPR